MNLVNAFYLAVAQILILLIVWAQQRLCCRFYCCWCRLYTTARLNAAQTFAVGVGVILPILVLLVSPLHYGEVKCCPIFAVGVGVILPILVLLVPPFYTTVTVNAAQILAVGVGVMMPILLLLVPSFCTTVRVNAAQKFF